MVKEEKLTINNNIIPQITKKDMSADGHILCELTVVGYELDEVKKVFDELSKKYGKS